MTTPNAARTLSAAGVGGIGSGANLGANLSLTARLTQTIALIGSVLRSSGRQTAIGGDLTANPNLSPALRALQISRSHSDVTGVFLSLRVTHQAGQAAPVTGDPAAQGGLGTVAGCIFLDRNGDGSREAGEAGAGGVTVTLDGRYRVQTDAQGHYDFGRVTAGPHRIEVGSDALPLPWRLSDASAGETLAARTHRLPASEGTFAAVVDVRVRSNIVVDVGAVTEALASR